MHLIDQANDLVNLALTATPQERISKIESLALPNDDGAHNKGAIKRLNKL